MRHSTKLLTTTGCLFLWAGGWVYSGRANGADLEKDATIAALNNAVAAAVEAAPAATAPAALPATAPATQPATAPSTDLAATKADIAADGTVEQFNAQDLDINSVLRILAERSKRNIIASKEVKGTVTVNLYNVTLHEALDAILTPNGWGYIEKGNFIYVYTARELEEYAKKNRKPVNRVFHLKYITSKDAGDMIKPLISTTAIVALSPTSAAGAPSGTVDTGGPGFAAGDVVVVNDFKENLDEIEKAFAEIDVRPKQVLVESTILRANITDNNALGIDFVSIAGMDFSSLTGGKLTNDVYNSFTSGTVPSNPSKAMAGTNFASAVPDGGLSIGFLSNNVSIFVRALETVADTNIVANPKIMALNKHVGRVQIGDELGYRGGTTQTASSTTETVEMLQTGIILTFRPFIMDDNYIRLEVIPEDSAGRINAAGLPEKQTTQVVSNLMIKDGRTAVIGGLFREQTTASRGQVPVLGNIPVVGPFFRRTSDDIQRVETIVLLTPHVIHDDNALYAESAKREQDVRRMMLGNRAGLQPWGRERLAITWLEKAQEEAARGNREKAIMFTDWALNSNPRLLEAMKLREDLTHKRMNEVDQSSITAFVKDVIATDPVPHNDPVPPAPTTAPATPK